MWTRAKNAAESIRLLHYPCSKMKQMLTLKIRLHAPDSILDPLKLTEEVTVFIDFKDSIRGELDSADQAAFRHMPSLRRMSLSDHVSARF